MEFKPGKYKQLKYNFLGSTGLKVSRLCFGALTIGPLQRNLELAEGAEIIRLALENGVNFIDTAEAYQTYPYIRRALDDWSGQVVIATKSYAYSAGDMEKSLQSCLSALGRTYIDIMLLHEQESAYTVKGHWDAVEYLARAREQGLVRAIGISTHYVAGVRAAASIPEFDIIHPIINKAGIGIQDGGTQDMLDAISLACAMGKGIYGMKSLGGGHLIKNIDEAIDFILAVPELASVAVGMQTKAEVMFNIARFSGAQPDPKWGAELKSSPRSLHIEAWCQGCGLCVEKCSAGALELSGGRAGVKLELCRLCGYCAAVCPEFCIKVV